MHLNDSWASDDIFSPLLRRAFHITYEGPLRCTQRAWYTFRAFAQFKNERPANRLCFAARASLYLLCTEIAINYVHFGRPGRWCRWNRRVILFSAIWNGILSDLAETRQQKQWTHIFVHGDIFGSEGIPVCPFIRWGVRDLHHSHQRLARNRCWHVSVRSGAVSEQQNHCRDSALGATPTRHYWQLYSVHRNHCWRANPHGMLRDGLSSAENSLATRKQCSTADG